jgi:predicted flap endonuclease-1-like 5' DNA nuclease
LQQSNSRSLMLKDISSLQKKENEQMPTITDIEGIGEAYAVKLRLAGVNTTESLLQKGSTRKGRQELAKATGFSAKVILKWVNRADLCRVSGIGAQYADLLEASGAVLSLNLRAASLARNTCKSE